MYIEGMGVCGGMVVAEPHYVEKPCQADQNERADQPAAGLKEKLKALTERLCAQLRARAEQLRGSGSAGEAEMLEIQAMMLADALFQGAVCRALDEGFSLAAAIGRGAEEQQRAILATGDSYLMERVSDVADMSSRLTYLAWDKPYPDLSGLERPVIVVAEDLQPSLLVSANPAYLKGLVLSKASRTSHIAILAAGRDLPAVVGCGGMEPLQEALQKKTAGKLFVDAEAGRVSFALSAAELESASARVSAYEREKAALSCYKDKPCLSADGTRIWLYGNIMEAAAAEKLEEYGADGVGLFRTEFLYMNRSTLPTEEEQFSIYRAVARKLGGKSVTIRTLDLGADKQTPALNLGEEDNPFLGFRAIRVCLARPEIFCVQLRAILRASAFGKVKVMFPMISCMPELEQALAILGQVKEELRQEGTAFDEAIKVGIMVEVPSVAVLAAHFIRKVDFFSIGSNDLTQYTLAVDRMNKRVAPLYNATDPAVLTLIRETIRAAEAAGQGKTCSLCGEMGADPEALPLLLGLGLRHVSVNPSAILRTKSLISKLDCAALRAQVQARLDAGCS